MPVFVTTDFKGKWPVGAAAAVHAPDEAAARQQLDAELERRGLLAQQTEPYTLKQVKPGETLVLLDGDY